MTYGCKLALQYHVMMSLKVTDIVDEMVGKTIYKAWDNIVINAKTDCNGRVSF